MLIRPKKPGLILPTRRRIITGAAALMGASALGIGPAFALPTLLGHGKITPSGGSGGTSAAFDSTGAYLIAALVSAFGATGSLSDNKGNTYTSTIENEFGGAHATLYYCLNPTVGTGHTLTGGSPNGAVCFAWFSGIATSGALDQWSFDGGNGGGSTMATSGLTPTNANSLYLVGASWGDNGIDTSSIDQSFTLLDSVAGLSGSYLGANLAYKVTSSNQFPTFTMSGTTTTHEVVYATFNEGSGGGGGGGGGSTAHGLGTLGVGH